jgi:NhaP-type Na+/H+ or K+/H+ antiporter
MDDSLQPTIDMLLNLAIFVWFGAVCPWALFAHNDIIPIYRLVALGILILLFRRLPVVFAMHKYIHQIEQVSQALFVGFFGPIGVGAIFYLSVCRQFLLEEMIVDGEVRADAAKTAEVTYIVVWFLVICSIVSFYSYDRMTSKLTLSVRAWPQHPSRQSRISYPSHNLNSNQLRFWRTRTSSPPQQYEHSQHSDNNI